MYRVVTCDGHSQQSRGVRYGLLISYLLFFISGVLLVASPTLDEEYGAISYVYSGFLLLGGLVAATGPLRGRWVGEFIGLPLMASALLAFGVEVWYHREGTAPYLAWANLTVLTAIATILVARWRVALGWYRFAHALALRGEDADDDDDD